MKKIVLWMILCASVLNGMETISKSQMNNQDQAHRELLGKVRKLEGDAEIYVGAGNSSTGEPIFFAMEKLDNKNAPVWTNYVNALYQIPGIINTLKVLNIRCQNQQFREELKNKGDLHEIELMDIMCPNQQKFKTMFSDVGIRAEINGFNNMLARQRSGNLIYIAYASSQPITGPFKPKKEIQRSPTPEKFEEAYPDIIMCMGVDMMLEYPTAEHRGIFKDPFSDIRDKYRNIAMKLHGWAGIVEEQIFHKTYVIIFSTIEEAELFHRSVKPGDMYIGIDTEPYPYKDEELRKKFPSIKQELIGNIRMRAEGYAEELHIFDLKVLSKYYTAK